MLARHYKQAISAGAGGESKFKPNRGNLGERSQRDKHGAQTQPLLALKEGPQRWGDASAERWGLQVRIALLTGPVDGLQIK